MTRVLLQACILATSSQKPPASQKSLPHHVMFQRGQVQWRAEEETEGGPGQGSARIMSPCRSLSLFSFVAGLCPTKLEFTCFAGCGAKCCLEACIDKLASVLRCHLTARGFWSGCRKSHGNVAVYSGVPHELSRREQSLVSDDGNCGIASQRPCLFLQMGPFRLECNGFLSSDNRQLQATATIGQRFVLLANRDQPADD